MGNSQSISREEKRREEQRRRELYEHGVLIPPSFGVAGSDTPPSAVLARTPSLVSALQQTSLSYQLLHYHTYPGVWLKAKANKGGSILASTSVPSDRGYQEGLLCLTQRFADRAMFELRSPSIGTPTLYGSVMCNSTLTASTQMDTKGLGWAAVHLDLSGLANQCFLPPKKNHLGFENSLKESQRSLYLGSWTNVRQFQTPISVTGYAAYQVPGVTLATETTFPFSSLEPQLSCHLSCELTDNGPPVVVNISKSPHQTSLSFSQVVTFDRYHVNLFDDRANKVRNTLGWTVDMSKNDAESMTQLSAGVAWQVNRALALKATHKNGNLTGAIVFKRWQQPRVTCALLFATPQQKGKIAFYGFGIEFETFARNDDGSLYGMTEDTRVRLSSDSPLTKTELSE